jgi:hypothetical protein
MLFLTRGGIVLAPMDRIFGHGHSRRALVGDTRGGRRFWIVLAQAYA